MTIERLFQGHGIITSAKYFLQMCRVKKEKQPSEVTIHPAFQRPSENTISRSALGVALRASGSKTRFILEEVIQIFSEDTAAIS